MPGTTRYSATFDRPYEEEDEEDLPAVPPLTRRSRSASWQATTANGRPYTPLGGSRGSHVRSASTDNGPQSSSTSTSPAHSTERIPTRTTGKVPVKTSHNPFQFVKVGQCSLYKKAEEQLKKTQKAKQPEALKEEEEEWQTNLDSWKSRRRKMSQDVFRRQEEMKELLQMEEPEPVAQQKKVKTFSEMVEERANKGRTLSLCLFSNPLGLDECWGSKEGLKDDSEMSCNDTHQSSGSGSEESSNDNSEDESDVFRNTQTAERNGVQNVNNTQRTRRTGAVHFLGNLNGVNNGISSSTEENGSNCDFKVSELTLNGETLSHKCEPCQGGAYNDSGLDSLSSSHRAGDIPDSGSDFSQDSGSSLDCDSPGITGIPTSGTELLEEFSSKDVHPSNGLISHKEKIDGMELCLKLTLTDGKSQQYGFTINGGKDKGSPVTVASVINGSISDLVGLKTGDRILAINKEDISSLSHSAVISSLKQSAESRQLELLVWRPVSTNVKQEKPTVNGSSTTVVATESPSKKAVPEQTTNKEISNKANSKATKVSSVPESSVDNRVDTVDSQSNNKKTTPVKQKDVNCKTPASTKSQTQETSASTSEAAKGKVETAASTADNQHGKSVESENEMFVDDFHSAPVSNNSKIPVAEKSPKILGKKMSKTPQESKKNKSPVSDAGKSEENTRKVNGSAVEDPQESSLNIIYQSPPSVPKTVPNAKELVSADSEHSVDKKVVNESPKSPAQTPTNKQEPKFNEKLTFETSEILPVDQVAEQMERLILEQLEEEERLKEKPVDSQASLHGSVITTTANVLSEHELSGIDTPPRQVEPPKEKPPPPPTSSSSTNKDSPLKRVNSTKRIKKEIQKRRSDFLGIEKPEEEESTIPPPPDLENILKLECEQERKAREMLGKDSLHQRESSFEEEEEIARKEREIIENLETEERMRMAKQTVKDESLSSSSSDASLAQIEAERIRKLQEERVRMEEERFLKEEQRIRLEEERQLKEREEQLRREEAQKPGDLSAPLTQSPCASVGNTTQAENSGNNTDKQKNISVGALVNANAGTNSKIAKSDSAPKSTTTVPVSATSPQIQANESDKKPAFVKKTKQENKKSKTDKQNNTAKSDNKTSIKSDLSEPQSQVVQPSATQSKMPENIPSAVEKEVVLEIKSSEISKSDMSQSAEENKVVAPQTEDAKSDVSASKQKPKALEASKNPQLSKQTSSLNENVKNKRCAFEQKSKDLSVTQNTKQNKNTPSQKEITKSTPVSREESEVLPSVKQASLQNGDVKTEVLISAGAQGKTPGNIPSGVGKEVVPEVKSLEISKSSDISTNAEETKIVASQADGDKCDVSVSKQKPKTPEASINLQQNKQTSSQNENVKNKRCAFEQKSKDLSVTQNTKQNKNALSQKESAKPTAVSQQESEVLPSFRQASQQNRDVNTGKLPGNIPSVAEKGIAPEVKSSEKCKSSGISQNSEENKVVASQAEDVKFDVSASEQKPKTPEVSKNLQQNKQTSSQNENVKNKRCAFEQKSKDSGAMQNTKQNKNSLLQKEITKPTSVSQKEPEVSVVSPSIKQTSQQNGDVKTKVLISKHKSPAFEIFQNAELKQKASAASPAPCGGSVPSKKSSPVQESKILESSNVQALDTAAKISVPETKSKDTEFSHLVEQSKVTVSQSDSSNTGSESKCAASQVVQNAEQKVTSTQTRSEPLKTCTPEQKSEVTEISLNTEPNKMCDKQLETTNSNSSIPVQKSKVLDSSQNVEKKQNIPTVENSSNNVCVSEQNSKMAPASPNIELSKDAAALQVEAAKTDKGVPEQKTSGNIVRVRKKKKGIPPKPINPENSGLGVSCPESPNKTGKSPLSPTVRTRPEDKTISSGFSQQNKGNSSSLSVGAKPADNKPVNQKNNSASGISSVSSSVTGKNAECKTSSNAKVENASDKSATASSSVLTTNSENTAFVSPISSSVSNDASLSQTGDGKNKDTSCMSPASGDQSSIAKETANNSVPTKPLKKKEVIRKERERLRQEQEALQREREEYRRQMMKEQELLKESQKPHAPDAPVSRVGAPPPLKPALPLPLTSLPHASQALKENVIYTSRSPPANSVSAAVGNHGAASQSPSVLSPPHNAAARSKATQNDARGPHKVPVKKQLDTSSESRYNQNHWLIQEAEMRRISEQKERQRLHPSGDPRCAPPFSQGQYHPMHMAEENYCGAVPGALQKPPVIPGTQSLIGKPPSNYPVSTQMHSPEQQWNYGQPVHPTPQSRKFPVSNVLSPGTEKIQPPAFSRNGRVDPSMQPPTKPSRVIPMDRQEQMLSVSGRKRCSHCGEELGRGAAMIIESLQLYYHIQCFRCCVCQAQLGNGSCGTDVRVRNNKLHCHNCYSNDEAGLKFSQV